jgi:hypothetical protein
VGFAGAGGGSAGFAAGGGPPIDPCSPTNGGFESCDGIDNDCDDVIDENGCPATCQGVEDSGSGYMICDSMVTWDEAALACAAENLRLATVESTETNQTLMALMYPADGSQDFSFFWIGLSRVDSSSPFTWASGSPLAGYTNWRGGTPGTAGVADCVQVNTAGEWIASRCDFLKRYACELE